MSAEASKNPVTEGLSQALPTTTTTTSSATSTAGPSVSSGTGAAARVCRVQVRLPNGRVLVHQFPSSAVLNDVTAYLRSSAPECVVSALIQV